MNKSAVLGHDIYDDDLSDDSTKTPGPGAYFKGANSTGFKVQKKPEKLQFFGSTATRFNYAATNDG